MTLVIATDDVDLEEVSGEDGYLRFGCPKCGKLILRYHPSTRGSLQLQCTRKGKVAGGRSVCRWADYVYFNILPEETE